LLSERSKILVMAENNLQDDAILGENGLVDMGFGAIGGLNPVFGNLYAGLKGARAQKVKEGQINDYSSNLDTWYNTEKNKDYLQSNVASNVLTKIGNKLRENQNQVANQQAITGGTDEAALAAKTAAQGKYNEAVGDIAAMGTARQDQVEGRYQNQGIQMLDRKTGLQDQKVQAAQTMQENNEQTMNSILSAATGGLGGVATAATGNTQMGVMGGKSANQVVDAGVASLATPKPANLGGWDSHGFNVDTSMYEDPFSINL
jgi:nucleoside diphosphate kinase